MPSLHRCVPGLLMVLFFLAPGPASASNIRLQNGEILANVTILRRGAASVEIRNEHGITTLPLASIDRIDGVRVAAAPAPSAPPTGDEHRVRFRLDGLMQGRVTFADDRGVRLVTALKNLAQTDPCTGEEWLEIGLALPGGHSIYRAGGCKACEGAGYVGRTGVFERLIFDDELRQTINAATGEDTLVELARAEGYRSCREDAAAEVRLGVTTEEEALQAI